MTEESHVSIQERAEGIMRKERMMVHMETGEGRDESGRKWGREK